MRIVDITEFYSERGGVRSHLDLKGQILRQGGHEHVIVAPGAHDGVAELESSERWPHAGRGVQGSAKTVSIAGPQLPYDANYHLLFRLDKVRRVVGRERPHVLEINSPYLAALSVQFVPRHSVGIRTLWWHSDFIDSYVRVYLTGRVAASVRERVLTFLWSVVRTIASGCDATFAAGRHQAEKLTAMGIPRVRCLPFGIDKQLFLPSARSEAFRDEARRGRSGPLFVAMGRLSVEKQWPVLLDGFRAFRATHAGVLFVIGDGPERARLAELARDIPDVHFAGFVKDPRQVARALASADAFVHACPVETFGLSVAQAISCGVPLVVPDQGGAAELARPGFSETFPAGDAQGLAAALRALERRDRDALTREALAARSQVASAKEQVERTVDVYRELLRGRAGFDEESRRAS